MITIPKTPKTLGDYYKVITSKFNFRDEWEKTLNNYVKHAVIHKVNTGNDSSVHVSPYPVTDLAKVGAWPNPAQTHSVFSAGIMQYMDDEWEYATSYLTSGNKLVEAITYNLFEQSPMDGFNLFAVTNDIFGHSHRSTFIDMRPADYLDKNGVYAYVRDYDEFNNPILYTLHSILNAVGEREPEDIRWLVMFVKPINEPWWFLVHPVIGAEAPRLMTIPVEEGENDNV